MESDKVMEYITMHMAISTMEIGIAISLMAMGYYINKKQTSITHLGLIYLL